jgi:hypothetical protein
MMQYLPSFLAAIDFPNWEGPHKMRDLTLDCLLLARASIGGGVPYLWVTPSLQAEEAELHSSIGELSRLLCPEKIDEGGSEASEDAASCTRLQSAGCSAGRPKSGSSVAIQFWNSG